MTTTRNRCPPAPPDGFVAPTALQTVSVKANPEPWVRLFWSTADPLRFARSTRGNRFDPLPAPWMTTQVLYAGSSLETAVCEALLRWHGTVSPGSEILLPDSELRARFVARFEPKRDLTLIDCAGLGRVPIEQAVAGVLARPEHADLRDGPTLLADDIFQCGPNEYDQTQRWGAWFRSQVPDADGLQWVSRQYNRGTCIVLFDDLCGSDLQLWGPPVPLYGDPHSAEHQALNHMLGLVGWGIDR